MTTLSLPHGAGVTVANLLALWQDKSRWSKYSTTSVFLEALAFFCRSSWCLRKVVISVQNAYIYKNNNAFRIIMNKRIILGLLVAIAVCGCQVKEENELAPGLRGRYQTPLYRVQRLLLVFFPRYGFDRGAVCLFSFGPCRRG